MNDSVIDRFMLFRMAAGGNDAASALAGFFLRRHFFVPPDSAEPVYR